MKTTSNFFFNVVLSVSQVLFPIITFPYASRILGPEGIGTVNFAESVCRYFMLFAAIGIPIYGIREIAKVRDDRFKLNILFSEIIIIHGITTFISLIIYAVIIFNVNKFDNNFSLYTLGFFYITVNIFSVEWFFNGLNEFKFVALRSIVVKLISLVTLFLIVKDKSDIFNYFLLNVLVLTMNNAINIYFLRNKVVLKFSNLNFKKHLRPMLYIFASTIAISVYVLIDSIILGFLKNDIYVGYYTVASKLNKITLAFIVGLGAVLIPQLSNSYHKGEMNIFNDLIKKSFDFTIIFSIPISIGLFICAPKLIILFSGDEFLPALTSMRIMVPLTLLIGFSNLFGFQILTPMGKDKYFMMSVLVGTLFSITLNFALIPKFNDVGSAMACIISELIVTILTILYALKVTTIVLPFKKIIIQLALYSPIFLISYLLDCINLSGLQYLLTFTIIIFIFFMVINLLITKSELITNFITSLRKNYERV